MNERLFASNLRWNARDGPPLAWNYLSEMWYMVAMLHTANSSNTMWSYTHRLRAGKSANSGSAIFKPFPNQLSAFLCWHSHISTYDYRYLPKRFSRSSARSFTRSVPVWFIPFPFYSFCSSFIHSILLWLAHFDLFVRPALDWYRSTKTTIIRWANKAFNSCVSHQIPHNSYVLYSSVQDVLGIKLTVHRVIVARHYAGPVQTLLDDLNLIWRFTL